MVDQFNSTYAGKKDGEEHSIPRLVLPAHYSFGDSLQSLDLRLSRSFVFQERWRVSLIGEVFNVYNKANLTSYSGDLTSAAFGQPTSRAHAGLRIGRSPRVSTGYESKLLTRRTGAQSFSH